MNRYAFFQFLKYFLLLAIALYSIGMIILNSICVGTFNASEMDFSKSSLILGIVLFSILLILDIVVAIIVIKRDKYRKLFTNN